MYRKVDGTKYLIMYHKISHKHLVIYSGLATNTNENSQELHIAVWLDNSDYFSKESELYIPLQIVPNLCKL